jgi:hypothetical protein
MSFNINYYNFFLQCLAMGGWVLVVAAVTAGIERVVYGEVPRSFDPKKDSTTI